MGQNIGPCLAQICLGSPAHALITAWRYRERNKRKDTKCIYYSYTRLRDSSREIDGENILQRGSTLNLPSNYCSKGFSLHKYKKSYNIYFMQINNLICLKLPDQQILIFYCNNKCHFYKSLQIHTYSKFSIIRPGCSRLLEFEKTIVLVV